MNKATVIQAPPGLGKTSLVVQMVAQGTGGPVEIYVPTHALAAEVARALRAANPQLTVNVIAGRSHPGANGKPLCKKHKVAEDVARAGGEVYSSLCSRTTSNGQEQCPHYASCPYINQFAPAQVTIYTHAHLPLNRMTLEPGVPEIAVIDEAFFQSCIEILDVPGTLLRAPFLGPKASKVCLEIEHALVQGLPLFAHLRSAGISLEKMLEALKELKLSRPSISPGMPEAAQRATLGQLQQQTLVRKLLLTVARESLTGRAESHGLTYGPEGRITLHTKKPIQRFQDRQGNSARILIIDGTADENIIGQFFDIAQFKRIQAARQATVTQCESTRCSTTSLIPIRNTDPKSKRAAKKRLVEVETLITRIAAQHPKVLVVGPQAITGNPNAKVKPLIKVPANAELAHFNAIRGIDRWKQHGAIVVIGRNEPPIKAVEAIARCVFLTAREQLQFADEWTSEVRGYRLKQGLSGDVRLRELSAALAKLQFPRNSLPAWIRDDFQEKELFWFATAMTAFFDEGI